MEKVILSGYILIPEEQLKQAELALKEHIRLSQEESGCLVFKVERDIYVSGKYHVYEEFIHQEAFDFHQKRTATSPWGMLSKDFERVYSLKSS